MIQPVLAHQARDSTPVTRKIDFAILRGTSEKDSAEFSHSVQSQRKFPNHLQVDDYATSVGYASL